MRSVITVKILRTAFLPTLILGSLALSACATEDYAAELGQPNFGRRALISDENVDARLLSNGLYASKPYTLTPYASSCLTGNYGCSQRTQSSWSSFDP